MVKHGNIAFVCDNFGKIHLDQCTALQRALPDGRQTIGIELFESSTVYAWGRSEADTFLKLTMVAGNDRSRVGAWDMARRIVAACRQHDVGTVLFAHYERPYILLAAIMIRLMGRKAFIMQDSKFDDYARFLWREVGKSFMMKPYSGGIAASPRCADYLRFLGVPKDRIVQNAYAIFPDRIRASAGVPPAPAGMAYADRNLVSVARLVEKKNHAVMLEAFALYLKRTSGVKRRLVICGSGPLEKRIREQVVALNIADHVELRGNLSADEVAAELGAGLCLLLPSTSEQYGIVVIEAQAMGLPVILSDNCGARDRQVRSGVEGFVIESDNVEGLANFMDAVASDEALWQRMSAAATERVKLAHSRNFARAVLQLVENDGRSIAAR